METDQRNHPFAPGLPPERRRGRKGPGSIPTGSNRARGTPTQSHMLKGHLPRVVYIIVYEEKDEDKKDLGPSRRVVVQLEV